MNKQRLSVVNVFVDNGAVWNVTAGTADPYSINLMLLTFPKAKDGLERDGIGALTPNHKQYRLIILSEESPYFNLGVLVKSMEGKYNEDSTQAILYIGTHLYNLIK